MKSMCIAGAVTCAMAIMVTGCTTGPSFPDITVETAANPKVDLTGYSTYAWAGAAAVIRDPERNWTPSDLDVGAEIVQLVNTELRAAGMSEVAVEPEVLALYAVGVDMKNLDLVVDPEDESERFEEIPRGGLMVILADPETRQVIWVGAAVADMLEEPDRELTQQRLGFAIGEMFNNFPN